MSVFLFSTYELDSSGAHSTDLRIGKVLDNIVDNLNDLYWQETIVKQIGYDKRKGRKIKLYLRVFRKNRIAENEMKSYCRFMKKEGCLIIDPIFSLEDYSSLKDKELSAKMYNDIFQYLELSIKRYKTKFDDFSFHTFFDCLQLRVNDIRQGHFTQHENDQLEKLLEGIID